MNILENMFVGLTILYPVAFIMILNGSYGATIKDDVRDLIIWFGFFGSLLAACFLLTTDIPRVSHWVSVYVGFFGLFALLFKKKIGIHYLPMLFCVSALTIFVASEFWEYPIFVYGTLGIFEADFVNWAGGWVDHFHRIYVLIIFGYLLRLTHWKPGFKSVSMIVLSVGVPFLLLSPLCFDYVIMPTFVRIWTLTCLGLGIYFGLDKKVFNVLCSKKNMEDSYISINKTGKPLE